MLLRNKMIYSLIIKYFFAIKCFIVVKSFHMTNLILVFVSYSFNLQVDFPNILLKALFYFNIWDVQIIVL